MRKRFVATSLTFHILLVALVILFSQDRPSLKASEAPIEVQFEDIHVHHPQSMVAAKPTHAKVESVQGVKKSNELTNQPVPAEKPVAPEQMQGPSDAEAWAQLSAGTRNEYLANLIRIILSHKHYPKASLMNEEQGTVQVKVVLNSQGVITLCEVTRSSDFARLDEAAVSSLKEIGTLPLPASAKRGIILTIPIRFELNPVD